MVWRKKEILNAGIKKTAEICVQQKTGFYEAIEEQQDTFDVSGAQSHSTSAI
jgi:hypothetical protein